jgi:hypothetical protein
MEPSAANRGQRSEERGGEPEEPASIVAALTRLVETMARYLTQEVRAAVRGSWGEVRAELPRAVVAATLIVLALVFVLIGVLKALLLVLPAPAAYLVAGGAALLGACVLLLATKGPSRGRPDEGEDRRD